ncbi:MAG: SLC13 family permease [Candidatus Bathyarchaeia archaeon]
MSGQETEIRKRIIITVILTIATFIVATLSGALTQPQIIAITLFAMKTYATLLLWRYRLPFAFMAIFLLMLFNVLDIQHLLEFAMFDVIFFLIGMMTIIGFLEEHYFFEYIVDKFIGFLGADAEKIVIGLMIISALLAALVDEVTSILIVSATILSITRRLNLSATPLLMMTVFATNIGSTATVVGNPIGVMIAFRAGLTFLDFLRWATPISIAVLALCILLCRKIFFSYISSFDSALKSIASSNGGSSNNERMVPEQFRLCSIIFAALLISLILHHPLEEAFHLERNTLLLAIPLGLASIVLLLDLERGREIVERRVEWRTLIFFALLFASVGTLKYVGVMKVIADGMYSLTSMLGEVSFLLIYSHIAAILSAFLDNILAIAMLIPVVSELEMLGVSVAPLWWASLFAGTLYGNLTMIGSTANIIALGIAERRGEHIYLSQWIRPGAIISASTLVVAILLLILQTYLVRLPF